MLLKLRLFGSSAVLEGRQNGQNWTHLLQVLSDPSEGVGQGGSCFAVLHKSWGLLGVILAALLPAEGPWGSWLVNLMVQKLPRERIWGEPAGD